MLLKMDKMKKRGQLTLFVIISIVVVVAIISYFMFYGDFGEENYDPKVRVVRDNILVCFEDVYAFSLASVAYQGGYYGDLVEGPVINLTQSIIPYYYYDGEGYVPSLDVIEGEIEKSAEASLVNCISSEFNEGFEFSYDEYSVDSEILDDEVVFNLDLDLAIIGENTTTIVGFNKKPISINSRIKDMHYIASEIVADLILDDEDWFDVTELGRFSREKELNFTISKYDEDYPSFVYTIYMYKEGEPSFPINYRFANKLSWPEFNFPEAGF